MELHPEWTAYLQQNKNLSHDDAEERNIDFLSTQPGQRLRLEVETTDSTVPARDGYRIAIRIYRALQTTCSNALVIFYHSGGFTGGSLETEDCAFLFLQITSKTA